ncbi:hypothetical protein ABFG93_13590 [Pseudalkalibacillus hwajinpoensis]|uniref:hypothetical protein n=1 Tax=Guptibacillus hwajinpoensis TaxID=208199 RepID=UPI00325B0C2A
MDKVYSFLRKSTKIKIKLAEEQIKEVVRESLLQKDIALITSDVTYKDGYAKKDLVKLFTDLANEQQVNICFPILENRDKRQPVVITLESYWF